MKPIPDRIQSLAGRLALATIALAPLDRLIELGKRFDYFPYPNRDHGLSEGNGTTVHVQMLITRYLIEHLPPGPR